MSPALVAALVLSVPPELITELDQQWAGRTPKTHRKVAAAAIAKLTPHAKEFEAAWRLARSYVWMVDTQEYWKGNDDRFKYGQLAMEHADQARKLKPKRVEGHYYYAWGVSQWSLGISIISALAKGAEGMYTGALEQVDAIDKSYDYYGSRRMWGRYYHALPWPKRDRDKAIELLVKSVEQTPVNMRGRLFLAEAYIGDGQNEKGCEVVAKALKYKPSAKDEPDYRVWVRGLAKLQETKCEDLLEDL